MYVITHAGARTHDVAKDALELLMSLPLPLQALGPQAFVTMLGLCSTGDLTNLGHTEC